MEQRKKMNKISSTSIRKEYLLSSRGKTCKWSIYQGVCNSSGSVQETKYFQSESRR